jgi:2-polyprenyl-6-methoxyphenol hydroxylase-like FAD-dependent oxidoreductase
MKEVPVLIAGGGPVGMTLAKTLASFGIECMLVEKNLSTTRHPKMDITNSRSMELFRKLGLSKLLREVAVPATSNFDVSWITSLSGHELHRFRYPSVEQAKAIIRERNDGSQPVEPPMRVSQVAIEPVLKRAIDAESIVDVRFGVAFEELVQGPGAVIATVKHVETDAMVVSARFAIAWIFVTTELPVSPSFTWCISAPTRARFCSHGVSPGTIRLRR